MRMCRSVQSSSRAALGAARDLPGVARILRCLTCHAVLRRAAAHYRAARSPAPYDGACAPLLPFRCTTQRGVFASDGTTPTSNRGVMEQSALGRWSVGPSSGSIQRAGSARVPKPWTRAVQPNRRAYQTARGSRTHCARPLPSTAAAAHPAAPCTAPHLGTPFIRHRAMKCAQVGAAFPMENRWKHLGRQRDSTRVLDGSASSAILSTWGPQIGLSPGPVYLPSYSATELQGRSSSFPIQSHKQSSAVAAVSGAKRPGPGTYSPVEQYAVLSTKPRVGRMAAFSTEDRLKYLGVQLVGGRAIQPASPGPAYAPKVDLIMPSPGGVAFGQPRSLKQKKCGLCGCAPLPVSSPFAACLLGDALQLRRSPLAHPCPLESCAGRWCCAITLPGPRRTPCPLRQRCLAQSQTWVRPPLAGRSAPPMCSPASRAGCSRAGRPRLARNTCQATTMCGRNRAQR